MAVVKLILVLLSCIAMINIPISLYFSKEASDFGMIFCSVLSILFILVQIKEGNFNINKSSNKKSVYLFTNCISILITALLIFLVCPNNLHLSIWTFISLIIFSVSYALYLYLCKFKN